MKKKLLCLKAVMDATPNSRGCCTQHTDDPAIARMYTYATSVLVSSGGMVEHDRKLMLFAQLGFL